jgi:hypothetical protein
MCFQVPGGKAYWRVYSMNGPPDSEDAAMDMLEAAWKHMHHNFWYQYGSKLLMYPAPPNDGERLVVIIEGDPDEII